MKKNKNQILKKELSSKNKKEDMNNIKNINFVVSYDNVDLSKLKIYSDNKGKPGVYL